MEPSRDSEDQADGAERAFEALRAEVAALRRGIELVYRQRNETPSPVVAGPDYSPTLGAIAREMQAVTTRLDAIERQPALAIEPAQHAAALRRELFQIGQDSWSRVGQSQAELDRTVRELRGMMALARERKEQREWLWAAAGTGLMGGALLWFLATAMLPWGGGTWLAGLAYGARWNAGQAMLQDAQPATWDRMVRLYNVCPQESATELCEAELAVPGLGAKAMHSREGQKGPR